MRVTTKGQVTIPKPVRDVLGIETGAEVTITAHGDHARIRLTDAGAGRGARIVERMRGAAPAGMTTDEVMALTRGEESDD